ncbi:MAG TPA: glycosyl hydrolase family 28-related protein [Methylocystis sp.]|nr:glycosyl hydrolase family 28-related protein [Methylocystis sp.]
MPLHSRRGLGASLAALALAAPSRAAAQRAAAGASPTYATLRALAAAAPPSDVDVVFVTGASQPGRGGALYRRAAREPAHAGKVRAADGGWWEIVPGDLVNVLQFGAVGDGRHDDASAIQAALDYAIYVDGAPKRVFLPALRYLLGDTLHIGYGHRYVTLEVFGEPGLSGAHEQPTGLYPRFNDRPCLNLQGGRRTRLSGLNIFGVNRDHLREAYDRFEDRGRRADWLGPALARHSDDPHAPYAGVTIDAYAGPPPPRPYPFVSYPASLGAVGQYGKNFSSETVLENCRIEGFCVGVAVQPGLVPVASNGDFITYRDCNLSYNIVGIADGHADSRCNNIENSRLHFCHTAIDTLTYGPGGGTFIANVVGSSFDNNWRILNVNIGGSGIQGPFPLRFEGCYGESVYSFGTAYVEGAGAPGVAFEGCKFEFSIKNQEYSPLTLLSCRGGVATFRNCVFQGGFGFARFDAAVVMDAVSFSHPQSEIFDHRSAAGRIAKSFVGEFWAEEAREVRLCMSEFFDFSGGALTFPKVEGLDSRAFRIDREAAPQSGGRPIPWWVEVLADERSRFPAGQVASLILDRAKLGVSATTPRGAEYEIVLPRAFVEDLEAGGVDLAQAFGAGDLVEDRESGALAYVIDVAPRPASLASEIRLKLRQLNGVRTPDHGRSWEVRQPIGAEKGVLAFHNARRFYGFSRRAMLETVQGKATARLTPRTTPQEEHAPDCFVAPGDYAASSRFGAAPNERLFRRARVSSVDRRASTVTFDATAENSFWGDACLFVKGNAG